MVPRCFILAACFQKCIELLPCGRRQTESRTTSLQEQYRQIPDACCHLKRHLHTYTPKVPPFMTRIISTDDWNGTRVAYFKLQAGQSIIRSARDSDSLRNTLKKSSSSFGPKIRPLHTSAPNSLSSSRRDASLHRDRYYTRPASGHPPSFHLFLGNIDEIGLVESPPCHAPRT